MKQKTLVFLILAIMIMPLAVIGQSDRLVRLQDSDSWTYDTPTETVERSVRSRFVNSHNKEVVSVNSNATRMTAPVDSWIDGNFSLVIEITNYTEYFSSRGYYWAGCDGEAVVTLTYNKTVTSFSITGELWYDGGEMGSMNEAIITGDPQQVTVGLYYSFVNETHYVSLIVDMVYKIVPSEPFTTTWNRSEVTAINLTQTIDYYNVVAYYQFNETAYNYDFALKPNQSDYTVKYVYAEQIGLPILIERSGSVVGPSTGKILRGKLASSVVEERLVSYDVEDASVINPNKSTIGFEALAILAIIAISVVRKKK